MDAIRTVLIYFFITPSIINAVPPEACFAAFRADDCGQPPTPVIYYWKSGSRCEVGMWRGCLPNPNMFADEYECVNTCIFVNRGSRNDILSLMYGENDNLDDQETTTELADNSTSVNSTTVENDANNSTDSPTADPANTDGTVITEASTASSAADDSTTDSGATAASDATNETPTTNDTPGDPPTENPPE